MAGTTAPTTGLSPERIVEVAHELISTNGLDWFSMRKLGAALDVNPMTIYLRFESKDALLDAVARHSLADFCPPQLHDAPWDERALSLCVALRDHILADRHVLALFATPNRLSAAVLHSVEYGLDLVEEIGYRDDDAVLAFRSMFWHTVGFTLVHNSLDGGGFPADRPGGLREAMGTIDPATHPTFARNLASFTTVDGDALFTHTTRLIVAGLLGAAPEPQENP